MGLFKTLKPYLAGSSIAIVVTSAKEGKITAMFYPTNQQDKESFIPITITDLPEVVDDNIEDFLDKYLKSAIEHFSVSEVVSTTAKKDTKKPVTKTVAPSKPAPAPPPPPPAPPPPPPPPPDLFNNGTVEDPEDVTISDETEPGEDVDEF